MTELQGLTSGQGLDYRIQKIVIVPEPRSVLHQRIEQRFDQMIEAGFVDELKSLYEQPGLNAELPAMRAVGYRQGWGWLEGHYSFEEMREKALAATRQLAKRQLTWLRREGVSVWYDLQADGVREKVADVIGGFLEA